MALDTQVNKKSTTRSGGELVYYFNPAIVAREDKVFFEDFVSNTMDERTFFNNFQRHMNGDEVIDADAQFLWENGIVQVDNYSTLRFFKESDPVIQKLIKEYQSASEDRKSDVYVRLSEVGLDREGALQDEIARLRAEIEALKSGKKSKQVE